MSTPCTPADGPSLAAARAAGAVLQLVDLARQEAARLDLDATKRAGEAEALRQRAHALRTVARSVEGQGVEGLAA